MKKNRLEYKIIIEACKEVDVPHALVEQDICPGDPLDSLNFIKL